MAAGEGHSGAARRSQRQTQLPAHLAPYEVEGVAGRQTPDLVGGVRITPPCLAGRRGRRERQTTPVSARRRRQEELSSDEEDMFQSPGRVEELAQAPAHDVHRGQGGEAMVEEEQEAVLLPARVVGAAEGRVREGAQEPVPGQAQGRALGRRRLVQGAEDRGGGSRTVLAPFINPVVPVPENQPQLQDVEGFGEIDSWGVWDVASSCIVPLEDVLPAFRKAFSTALATVLRRIDQADTDISMRRALKWMLVLGKLLLREPRRGGRRGQGSGELAARFEMVREGNWGGLLPLLKRDEDAEKRRKDSSRRTRVVPDPAKEKAIRRKTVLALISRGKVGMARRRVTSNGLASMADPVVKRTMQEKYPPRSFDLPDTVLKANCMESIPCLKDSLLGLAPAVSVGFGGLRNEYLRCAAENWDDRELRLLESFGLQYLNGKLPPWFYRVANSASTVALFKTPEQDPTVLRPVGVKMSLIRFLHKEVIISSRDALREYLEPHQLALAPARADKLVHTVRMMTELHPDWPCVAMDIKNAHNEISRSKVITSLEAVPTLQHLAQHSATVLASTHRLESSGEAWGEAPEGGCQGDPEAGADFCVAIHEPVRDLARELSAAGGVGIFGNDDGFAVGPPEVVFKAVERFARNVLETCNLTLQVSKTKVYLASGEKPAQAPVEA